MQVYNSAKWKEIRKEVLERDNYVCQNCGTGEGRMNVHHKMSGYVDDAMYLKVSLEYLETLCAPCHMEKHGIENDDAELERKILDILIQALPRFLTYDDVAKKIKWYHKLKVFRVCKTMRLNHENVDTVKLKGKYYIGYFE